MTNRTIIPYKEANLSMLDAGVCIEYPRGSENTRRASFKYYSVPSFLIIGAAKCGTQELVTWLQQHPNLQAPTEEVNFFNDVIDIEQEWGRYVLNPHLLISKKRQHVANLGQYTFEKTPGYFWKKNRGVPTSALIKRMMPSGKFIIILRNPTDRAYSAFQHSKRKSDEHEIWSYKKDVSFEDLIQIEPKVVNPRKNTIRVGHYAKHLNVWLNYFSREQLMVLTMEDFKKNPFNMMDRIQKFLGIKSFDYRSLAQQTDRGFWVLNGQPSKAHNKAYQPMLSETRKLLDDYYAPHNDELKRLFPELTFPW